MLKCKKGLSWSAENGYQNWWRSPLQRFGSRFQHCQFGVKGIFLCALTLLAFGTPSVTFGLASCNWYASPTGSGNGWSKTTPFQIADFWAVAGPGQTLCLLDGTYRYGRSMITPPKNLHGASGSPITVRALNDGKVDIDGQRGRYPVSLLYNDWFVLEGFNAHDSSGSVISLSLSKNNIVRRVVAWNAPISANSHVFSISRSQNTLLEDVAGFGTGRKIFEPYLSTNITIRRAWGRWEGSTQSGPKMTYSLTYNSLGTKVENSVGTWSGQMMGSYPDQPYGPFGMDRFDSTDRRAYIKLLGSISYVRSTDKFVPPYQIYITKIGEVELKDVVVYTSGSKRQMELHPCKVTSSWSSANCPDSKLTITNATNIGGSPPYISSNWKQKNVVSGPNNQSIYPAGDSIFDNTNLLGGTVCKRYVNGVLTQEPLWPWPMDQRIYASLQQAGKAPFYVTQVIESLFGSIPSACKKS